MPKAWIPNIVSIVISIVVTVLVSWYGISRTEKQAFLAEEEREKKIIENLAEIVEEHVMNGSIIEFDRLNRLILAKSSDERISKKITHLELLYKAEYNILNSRHLGYDKKIHFEAVFDSVYSRLMSQIFKEFIYNDSIMTPSNNHKIRDIIDGIQSDQDELALQNLEDLVVDYNTQIKQLESQLMSRKGRFTLDKFIEQFGRAEVLLLALLLFFYFFFVPKINSSVKSLVEDASSLHDNEPIFHIKESISTSIKAFLNANELTRKDEILAVKEAIKKFAKTEIDSNKLQEIEDFDKVFDEQLHAHINRKNNEG